MRLGSARTALSGLTTRGRCLLAAGAALIACALALGQRDLLRVGVLLLALPLCAAAVVSRTRYRLTCDRALEPTRIEAGRPASVRLVLENVSRLPSGVLLMEDALPYTLGARPRFVLDRIEPRGVREVDYQVRSEVRGRFAVGPLAVRLTDPFGLCELTRSFTATSTLVVTPTVSEIPGARLGGNWSGGGEAAARLVAPSGSDDAATREYRHGDDLRKVHWRSTARVGELMVRREEQPFQSRATLLLDSRASAHRGDGPGSSFEWAVSAVASVAVALSRLGFHLRLVADDGSDVTPSGVPCTDGVILDALAVTATGPGTHIGAATAQALRGGDAGAVVAVVGLLDREDAERLARLGTSARTSVVLLLDVDSWAPAGAKARATALAEFEHTSRVLTAGGWRVVPIGYGTTLASVWPMATGSAPVARVTA